MYCQPMYTGGDQDAVRRCTTEILASLVFLTAASAVEEKKGKSAVSLMLVCERVALWLPWKNGDQGEQAVRPAW